MTTQAIDVHSIATLAASLDGHVVMPDDETYDAARQVFLGDVDRRPAAIARVASADDVARVIEFAVKKAKSTGWWAARFAFRIANRPVPRAGRRPGKDRGRA